MNAITDALKWILIQIHQVVSNYGWSIVIFTILVKLALMPLDVKNRKGMRKMAKIQPELNKLQKKYANDKQKLQQKQSELMRKERYSPLSGCLPLLIQMPILFAMFGAMRALANEQVVAQVFTFLSGGEPVYDGWLWVRNIWAADSLFASVAPDVNAIKQIPFDIWEKIFNGKISMTLNGVVLDAEMLKDLISKIQQLPGFSLEALQNAYSGKAMEEALNALLKLHNTSDIGVVFTNIQTAFSTFGVELFEQSKNNLPAFIDKTIMPVLRTLDLYQTQTAHMPGWSNFNLLIINLQVFLHYNGYLILPAMAGLSQVLMTKLTPGATGAAPVAGGQEGQASQAAGMSGFMKYFFPLFSVFITLTSNAGFALYWVVSNLIATGLNVLITRHYDRQDRLEAAVNIEGTVK